MTDFERRVDQARQLNQLAKQHAAQENFGMALKLLEQSLALYETADASDMIINVEAKLRKQQRRREQDDIIQQQQQQQKHHEQQQQSEMRKRQQQQQQQQQQHQQQHNHQHQQQHHHHHQQQQQHHHQQDHHQQQQQKPQQPPPPQQQRPPPSAATQASLKAISELPQDDDKAAHFILQCKTYYDVLFITTSSNETQIKANYRKLALRFHPDKSSSSHAEEAMKVISAAYKTLTDDGERRKYDASLHRPTGMSARQQFQQQYQFRGRPNQAGGAFGRRQYDDDELTAEDLFNMFFFNAGGPKVTPATRPQRPPQQQHHHTQREQHTQWNGAMHFIPLLIMLMLTLFTLFSFGTDSTTQTPSIISTPSYSFEQRQRYQIRQITPYLEVPFYVSRDYYWYVKHQPERIDNTKLYEEIEGNILTKQDAACNKALREHAADATGQCEKSQKLREKYLTAKQVLGKVKNNDANVHAEIIKKHTKGGK